MAPMDCGAALAMTKLICEIGGKANEQPRLHHGKQASWDTLSRCTANLPRRAYEHREGVLRGFSAKYGCKTLVWYELRESMIEAITREKQIKAGSRANKLALIETLNPKWNDLYESLM
jgi:putative endonuclease